MLFPTDTLFKCAVRGQQGFASEYVNVHHFYQWSGGDAGESEVRDAIYQHFYDLFYSCRDKWPSNVKWADVHCQYKRPLDTEWQDWTTIGLMFQGNDGSHSLPSGCSAQVTAKTNKRKRRGRKFLPPFGETWSQDQTWTANALLALAAYAFKYIVGQGIGSGTGWLYPIIMEGATFVWNALVTGTANTTPAYQRRRKPGVGA